MTERGIGESGFQKFLKSGDRSAELVDHAGQRCNDWLIRVGRSFSEGYANFDAALIVYPGISSVFVFESLDVLCVEVQRRIRVDSPLFILQAHAQKRHHLESWDELLVFVEDVHFVNEPQGRVLSWVGLYYVDDEFGDPWADCFLFQGALDLSYHSLPCLAHWELRPVRHPSAIEFDSLAVKNVHRRSEVVEGVPNDRAAFFKKSLGRLDKIYNEFCRLEPFWLDYSGGNSVPLATPIESRHKSFELADVLFCPFDLEP